MIGGLLEITAVDGAATVSASRPASLVNVPLPVRVSGLNPNWSAGVYLHRGYVLGNYGEGTNRYRAAGVDPDGRVYTGLFTDHADRTEVTIGHPVVCDAESVFIQVTLRDDRGAKESWHVSVNNPTDDVVETVCRSTFAMPGLELAEQSLSLPPGGYAELGDGDKLGTDYAPPK